MRVEVEHEESIVPSGFLQLPAARGERLARRILLGLLGSRRFGGHGTIHLKESWAGGVVRTLGSGEPSVDLTIADMRAYSSLVYAGSRGLGRSYVNGLWDSTDLTSLVRVLFWATQPTRRALDSVANRGGFLLSRARSLFAPSAKEDRENIHAHYDLSNDFFALMLDETMAYSCAVFPTPTSTLHEAQIEKFDRICRKLNLMPGERVIEIGTGWGGFAIHAARRYGVHVTTTTISESQRRLASKLVADAGLSHLVTVLGDHYDDLVGSYDALVSVEMIEAVDWRKYGEFFSTCSSLLKGDGRMLLQAITIPDFSFERAKHQRDFIRDLIFPGGCIPSVASITDATSRWTDLRAVDLEDIGVHYAYTLRIWRETVHSHSREVRTLGFDERFMRLWDLYLSYCEAAFIERHISDIQLLLHKPGLRPPLAVRGV